MTLEEFKMMPLFLKRKDVLAVTGWSPKHLYKLVAAGKLKPVKSAMVNTHQYFKRSDLEAMLT
jgi:hypothetical protein